MAKELRKLLNPKMVLRIYLADLVYDTIKTNYAVPLNIGYIAAYIMEKFDDIEIKLFKYPKNLEKAIKDSPPDILALSNYSWNSMLNQLFIRIAKKQKPDTITVLGGPNIRLEENGIREFLEKHPDVDYYILHEGEEPFANLIKYIQKDEKGEKDEKSEFPHGCATITKGSFSYTPIEFSKKSRDIELPSPYLAGLLDKFLADPDMIPLLETNRGCPFGCVYCAWGISALSRVRSRSIDVVNKEIEYIAEKSAKQPLWIICDANFGIFPRDVEIAATLRKVMDKKGYSRNITVWQAKNTGERNIEISNIMKNECGFIAIQSADKDVLEKTGRGAIQMDDVKKQIQYYKDKNMDVMTDILIGLPGESASSHLQTLCDAFDMGFDIISPMNIRMLPGSKYDSEEYRNQYDVKTRFRLIFGAYGIYDDKLVFELEEGIRATKDMTEEELNNFKVHHWLMYLAWNGGISKPLLEFGRKHGVNPAIVFDRLAHTQQPTLKKLFDDMKKESMDEWFDDEQEMIEFYSKQENFSDAVEKFIKLNFKYIALVFQDPDTLKALQDELISIVESCLKEKGTYDESLISELISISDDILCKDLLEKESSKKVTCNGKIASIILKDPKLSSHKSVELEIYRPKRYVSLSQFYLQPDGKKDFSVKNLSCFLEIGGLDMLTNRVRIAQSN